MDAPWGVSKMVIGVSHSIAYLFVCILSVYLCILGHRIHWSKFRCNRMNGFCVIPIFRQICSMRALLQATPIFSHIPYFLCHVTDVKYKNILWKHESSTLFRSTVVACWVISTCIHGQSHLKVQGSTHFDFLYISIRTTRICLILALRANEKSKLSQIFRGCLENIYEFSNTSNLLKCVWIQAWPWKAPSCGKFV